MFSQSELLILSVVLKFLLSPTRRSLGLYRGSFNSILRREGWLFCENLNLKHVLLFVQK